MKKSLFNVKIPTLLGIIILLAAFATGFFMLKRDTSNTQSQNNAPKEIFITNISDSEFTVSWITDSETLGYIKYGESTNLNSIVLDDRDQLSGEKHPYVTHFITAKNLKQTKKYYFEIVSGNKTYNNDGQPYNVILGPTLGSQGEAKIVSGKILNPDNSNAADVIVYLNSANFTPVSTITDKDGRWAIFLNKTRTTDLNSYALFDPEATILKIDVQGDKKTASAITVTKNAFPVPDIILGHSPYDFREKIAEKETVTSIAADLGNNHPPTPNFSQEVLNEPIEEIPEDSASGKTQTQEEIPSQFFANPESSESATQVTIQNPSTENEELNTQKPEFSGTGPANKVLTIQINSTTSQSATVTVDDQGQWTFTPSTDLSPGNHTVTVSYVDDNGQTQQIARNFVVLAAGESELPALTSTPSASVSPSPSLSPGPEARTTLPSTDSGVPKTGFVSPTYILLFLGSLFTFGSIFLFYLIDKRKYA